MKEEIYNKLVDKIREEISDAKEYENMLSDTDGFTKSVIRCIIKDEKSHARFLMYAIEKNGREVPADIKNAYDEMTITFHRDKIVW